MAKAHESIPHRAPSPDPPGARPAGAPARSEPALPCVEGYVEIDRSGVVIAANRLTADVYGVPAEAWEEIRAIEDPAARQRALVGALAARVVDPETFAAGIRRQLAAPGEITFEDVPLLDGRVVERYGLPRRGPGGEVTGRIFLLRDVTARRRADAELRARARQQEAVAAIGALALDQPELEALFAEGARRTQLALDADLVHVLDRSTGGAFALRGEAGPLAGSGAAASEGLPAAHAVAAGTTVVTADAAKDERFRAAPGALASGVSVVVRGRGGPRGVLCAHWRLPRGFSDDEVHFVESVAHVLSSAVARAEAEQESRHVQARLALSERMASIGTLAGGVAHELNNPLAYVSANLCFADERLRAEGEPADLELADAIRDAREGAERMRTIIRDLQTFSRGDDERPAQVRLEPVLDSCVAMAWGEIRHRARLVKDLSELPPVRGAEGRLAQVFLNLIVNAAQAIPVGAADRNEIRLSARATADGRVSVEVKDTGTGIAPEHLPRIFDPFFTTKPLGAGTGLGLSICHGIVSALGGAIEVESAPGHGSTFRVLLPAAPPPRPRVLVVDDDALVGAVVRRALGPDHDVTVTGSGRAALDLVRAGERFDVVVSDLLMPEMTGMELHAELDRLDPGLADRTLFMTGGAFTSAARAFVERMQDRIVEKPFDVDALRAAVARRARPPR